MRRVVIFAMAALLAVGALADEAKTPTLVDPLPFDHAEHAGAFDKSHVGCVDCHPVGLRLHDDKKGYHAPAVGELEPPLGVCHGCHRGDFKGAPRAAVGTCTLCHANREELIPVTHAVGWLQEHGGEGRARGASCADCHDSASCVDCHDVRGPLERDPHPPGWRTIHGVEARLDPYSCSYCHDGETCVSCHSTGATPW